MGQKRLAFAVCYTLSLDRGLGPEPGPGPGPGPGLGLGPGPGPGLARGHFLAQQTYLCRNIAFGVRVAQFALVLCRCKHRVKLAGKVAIAV